MIDATMKQYILPVICLLAMLLRDLWIGMEQENIVISTLEVLIEEEQEPTCIIQQIHVVLMKLWTTHWRKMSNCPQSITDPTKAALALMTLNQDGSFKEPKDVTKIIAKLENCMDLTFLKEIGAQAAQAAHINGDITKVAACDVLQPWFNEKTYFTFAPLCNTGHLQLHMRPWVYHTSGGQTQRPGHPSISWAIPSPFLTYATGSRTRRMISSPFGRTRSYDPSNMDVGYSFLFNPKNACFQDCTCLVRAVIKGQGGFPRFLLQEEEDGKPICNHAALQKLLLLCTKMLSGAPARGTELTAAIYCNTQTWLMHNLMVFRQHVTLLCQYSKTSGMTGHDKLIPHSLDAITSNILIQDLALARPFA
ncbi:hypothetical protein JVT61DRAFT_7249 [Boletus reticuloceps]|uniref:Uncharacterized protein n=1 Tax=Boletus reticuloceps TaxID=495285 RepID=A0A8I3A7B3_9AGAM|nr:hypothetical protein JVT61DRAFT_7249 [Boletus reticuloceps]